MQLRAFLKENRTEIDKHIRNVVPNYPYSINDKDRTEWINNDEMLYEWAKSEGVKL